MTREPSADTLVEHPTGGTVLQFQMPNITREQLGNHRTRFEVEPLDRGFGHTFGNALRRVLLSRSEEHTS